MVKYPWKNIPRWLETYGLGREGFICHSLTIFLHFLIVSLGNVSENSSATLRCLDAISTAFVRFVSSNGPTNDYLSTGRRRVGEDVVFTKSKGFPPIPAAPTIIQCGVPRARTHFSCRQSSEVDVCPLLFNGLTMGPSHTRSVIEGITNLTSGTVGRQVELGHEGSDGET